MADRTGVPQSLIRVFVGWDSTEDDAYQVCASSILKHCPRARVAPIKLDELRAAGIYTRQHIREGKQLVDHMTKQTFTTEFTFSRYLVPALAGWRGWALFCDCDFLFRANVENLFALADKRFAVMVAKQRHVPLEGVKMEGLVQEVYPRKNWTSLILWNCEHPANARMVQRANDWQKDFLHTLTWLPDELIGDLPPQWNWLEGVTPGEPLAVHFTAGLPRMSGYERAAYAQEWRDELARVRLASGR